MSNIVIGIDEIKSLIPHRHPMLFIEQVEIDTSFGTKKGLKAKASLLPEVVEFWRRGSDNAFLPIMAIEALAQVVGVASVCVNEDYRSKTGVLMSMENVILAQVPSQGLQIDCSVTVVSANGKAFKARGQVCCGDRLIAMGDFTCGLLE